MKLKIKSDFEYFHKGYERRGYTAGEEVEAEDEEFIAVATKEGWAVPADGSKDQDGGKKDSADDSESKSKGDAPENKAKGKK